MIKNILPVLSSNDIKRDLEWYKNKLGCRHTFGNPESGYVGLALEQISFHLQWHQGDANDPINASVVKIFVTDIRTIYNDLIERKIITEIQFNLNTGWNTHEIGLFDLNNNAIYFVEEI